MKTSFDYDGTIGDVEQMKLLAKLLKLTGIEIYILTARFEHPEWNNCVFDLAAELGIKRENILICNGRQKTELIKEHGIQLHFDDDVHEVTAINDRPELGCHALLLHFKLDEVLNCYRAHEG